MILRCTKKLLGRLPDRPEPSEPGTPGLLGDWHATLLLVKPAWLVVAVNDASRLPVLLPAREFSTLLARIPESVADVLGAISIDGAAVAREREAMRRITVGPSASRSVLGTMNDFTFQLEWIRHREPDLTPMESSLFLANTPVGPLSYEYPADVARRLFASGQG